MIRKVDGCLDDYKNTGATHQHGRRSIVHVSYIDGQSDAQVGNETIATLLLFYRQQFSRAGPTSNYAWQC